MHVYLAAAMTSPDRDLPAIRDLRDYLEAHGHAVPTRHVAEPDGREIDTALSDTELANRDLAWLRSCDALIAEVSTPSHGVGVEVALAAVAGTPVLLLHRAGIRVSRLLVGLEGTRSAAYATAAEREREVDAFLAACRPPNRR